MESNFDDNKDTLRSTNQILCQALPAEVDVFDTSPKPSCVSLKTNLENVKLRCTIGDPPVLLYLPDDTSSTPTITAFFHIITELLCIAQSEYVCTYCDSGQPNADFIFFCRNLVMLHRGRPTRSIHCTKRQ